MNKYLNPEALAEALDAGSTADEIAAAMAKALNDALATKKAKEEKVNALAEAETAVIDATVNYVQLLFASEGVDMDLSESDWNSLRENTKQGLDELRKMARGLAVLSKLGASAGVPAAKPQTKVKETATPKRDPIAEFLAANGL